MRKEQLTKEITVVHVVIDKTRKNRLPCRINDPSLLGKIHFCPINPSNAVALNDNRCMIDGIPSVPVNESASLNDKRLCFCTHGFSPSTATGIFDYLGLNITVHRSLGKINNMVCVRKRDASTRCWNLPLNAP
ncbi:MAG: hypothetical protein ACE5JQ_07655 [Candidatus Methylomirabilales bacterium]